MNSEKQCKTSEKSKSYFHCINSFHLSEPQDSNGMSRRQKKL